MKYEHFKKYLLYKYYSGLISKKFIPKCTNNMSNKQLQNYLLKLKILYKYSKKCYVLREEYKELCISENERDIGHEIAIMITKEYNYDVLKLINKITPLITFKIIHKTPQNKFDIFNTLDIEENLIDEIEHEIIQHKDDEDEHEHEHEHIIHIIEESDEDILDKIILEKQQIVNDIYNAVQNKFVEYKINYCTMSLLYMTVQLLSLHNFDIIFNRLPHCKKKLLHDIILNIDKFTFIKTIVRVRKTYIFTRPQDNIEDIIYCDVLLKGETKINPIFIQKRMKIDLVIQLLYIQLIHIRIRSTDRKTFEDIIGNRLPKLSKNIKSKNNVLDPDKYVGDLINDNDTLYLYLDF